MAAVCKAALALCFSCYNSKDCTRVSMATVDQLIAFLCLYKEPAATYMAPVENRRKSTHILNSEGSEESEKKHKKRTHKRKKGKGKSHRKHHKEEKKKHPSKVNSVEIDRNVVSLEDSSGVVSK